MYFIHLVLLAPLLVKILLLLMTFLNAVTLILPVGLMTTASLIIGLIQYGVIQLRGNESNETSNNSLIKRKDGGRDK